MERKFIIYGAPVSQPRPRAVSIAGKAQVYEDRKHPVQAYKAACRQEAGRMFEAPIDGPVGLRLLCIFPRPLNKVWKKRDMPRYWHAKKPDADNIIKSIQDALNGVAFRDDSQVVEASVQKVVAAGDEQPRTEVVIYTLV